ncbi:MAG: NHL repeat-containing protein [Caldilineaceae bacterium]
MQASGSSCLLNDAGQPGCVDPDGAGPLVTGDGQFREPWGIAVSCGRYNLRGRHVNGRIQSSTAREISCASGVSSTSSTTTISTRSGSSAHVVAVAQNGDLLVADTGNKRILRFTPNGDYVSEIGGGGVVLGRFEEPVSVAVNPTNGNIYVADIWNQRIQVLSPDLSPQAEWPVPSWQSQDIWDKAFVAVGPNGAVYASDPQYAQIFVYNSSGQLSAGFGQYGAELNRFAKPNGLPTGTRTQVRCWWQMRTIG